MMERVTASGRLGSREGGKRKGPRSCSRREVMRWVHSHAREAVLDFPESELARARAARAVPVAARLAHLLEFLAYGTSKACTS